MPKTKNRPKVPFVRVKNEMFQNQRISWISPITHGQRQYWMWEHEIGIGAELWTAIEKVHKDGLNVFITDRYPLSCSGQIVSCEPDHYIVYYEAKTGDFMIDARYFRILIGMEQA